MSTRSKLLIILAVFMVLDVATTVVGLRLGFREGNPLAVALLGFGAAWLVLGLAKLVGVLLIWLAQRPLPDKWSHGALLACNVAMVAVVANNVAVIA